MGLRAIVPVGVNPRVAMGLPTSVMGTQVHSYEMMRYASGLLHGESDGHVPLEVNLDLANGVSFMKGDMEVREGKEDGENGEDRG